MTTTEKTPPLGIDGAEVLESNHPHSTNPRPTVRYAELSLIRALLNSRCGDAVALCAGQDIRALHSDDRRLVLRELLAYGAEQALAGHPDQPVAPAAVMARVQAAGGTTAAMQELTDALTGPIDGMQAGTVDIFAIPDLWQAVNIERLWRAMDSHAYALREAAARRDAVAVPRLLNSHAPMLLNLAEVAGLIPNTSDAEGSEDR
ncbi:hypothetical protein BJF89_07370 [Corynebacterium sp. CNJ-954]|uniref:hypothetical protein n=1 Tax=Corynebacterium sp. CNJ-954 TaxID=1904962 RepID=UPI00095F957E|nr:hypothetical protein [Corynebacterium sp. CNJ-954]OLT51513.1 hypothetical protein BJF89_07370 [Corynebacterium sp. CNJ-954]